jgi:chitin synthase
MKIKKLLDISSIAVQISGFFIWPMAISEVGVKFWLFPVAAILISCHWWENFVTHCSPYGEKIYY